ncbi:unnamed protein product [Discosporangium mesarthrocarpum]
MVMEEATEVPPFGFHVAFLEQRLKRRLGFEVSQSAITDCLSPYYNLSEWQDRYVVTGLGDEPDDFPGKGSGNRLPLSPLKGYDIGRKSGPGRSGRGVGAVSSSERAEEDTDAMSEDGDGDDVDVNGMDAE